MILQAAREVVSHLRKNLVGHGIEVRLRLVVKSGGDFHAREVEQHAFAFVFIIADVQRVRPGRQRVVRAERFDAVVALGVVGGEDEIVRRQFHRLPVKPQRLVENLLLVDVVIFPRVLAIKINRRGEILVIHRLGGVQPDGFGVIQKRVVQPAMLAVIICELVPHGGIFRVELPGIFVLHLGGVLLADVVEKTAVGEKAAGAVGMIAEKTVVAVLLEFQPRADAPVEFLHGRRVGAGDGVGAHPVVHLGQGRVVGDHQVAQLFFLRVVDIHQRHRDADVLLHEIADGLRLVGGQQRAQKSNGQITHAFKVSILKTKDRIYQRMDRRGGAAFSRLFRLSHDG